MRFFGGDGHGFGGASFAWQDVPRYKSPLTDVVYQIPISFLTPRREAPVYLLMYMTRQDAWTVGSDMAVIGAQRLGSWFS